MPEVTYGPGTNPMDVMGKRLTEEKTPAHVEAAQAWTEARSRLIRANDRNREASAQLEAAEREEQAAWERLESAACRNLAPAPGSTTAGKFSRS